MLTTKKEEAIKSLTTYNTSLQRTDLVHFIFGNLDLGRNSWQKYNWSNSISTNIHPARNEFHTTGLSKDT
jgi:hypothetical protein